MELVFNPTTKEDTLKQEKEINRLLDRGKHVSGIYYSSGRKYIAIKDLKYKSVSTIVDDIERVSLVALDAGEIIKEKIVLENDFVKEEIDKKIEKLEAQDFEKFKVWSSKQIKTIIHVFRYHETKQ